jgi:hypothetical protein
VTTPVALALALALVALLAADRIWMEGAGLLWLGRGLADLTEYLAFWR